MKDRDVQIQETCTWKPSHSQGGGGRNEAVHSWGLRGVSHEERKAGAAGGERLDENPCMETCSPSLASVAWK